MYALMQYCLTCLLLTAQDPGAAIQSLLRTGNSSYMRGDYVHALPSFELAWAVAQKTPPDNAARYDILHWLTKVHAAAGEFNEADRYLQLAIQWRETVLGADDPKIADDLVTDVALCRGMKAYDQAREALKRVLALHTAMYGGASKEVADDYSRMAQIDLDQKKPEDAVGDLNRALHIRTKLAGPLDTSLVPDLDRLGEVYITLRSYEYAEFIYRQALVIRESVYGKVHADLIATVDGLAYACFGQKKYDEAEGLYQRLLGLWVASVGKEHPMVANAWDKVAIFYAEQKKFEQAKDAADHATAIRALSLAAGLELEATQQWDAGNQDGTRALLERAIKVVEPPDPLYDGVHKEIAEMLGTLGKSGAKKTATKK